MQHIRGKDKATRSQELTNHLANERTFLSWIRTSIGIMAFGFVIEKFSLFIKELGILSQKESNQQYSDFFGIILVLFGVLLCLLTLIKYKKIEKQINNGVFKESIILDIMLGLAVLLVGIFLVIFLFNKKMQL